MSISVVPGFGNADREVGRDTGGDQRSLDVGTVSLTRSEKQASKSLGSNPRRSWCIELVMDTFTLGRPHAYPACGPVSGGGTS